MGPPDLLGPGSPAPRRRRGTRTIVLGSVGALVLAGLGVGGVFAWRAFSNAGPQPAEALPASTVAYVSLDLDPSGKQKLAALDTLGKFPGLREDLGLDSDSDLRQAAFEAAQSAGLCPDLDFADDVEPWLGDRFGVAAIAGVPGATTDFPTIAAVVQVDDSEAAATALDDLTDCSGGGGYAISDGWAVIAENEQLATAVVDEAADAPLADSEDFRGTTDAAGDPGILNIYVGPGLGDLVAQAGDLIDSFAALACAGQSFASADPATDPFGSDVTADATQVCPDGQAAVDGLTSALDSFGGLAVALRFEDGGIELETASRSGEGGTDPASVYGDRAREYAGDLPSDTALALGLSLTDGWAQSLLDATGGAGGQFSLDALLPQLEGLTGLSLPEDAETLLGDGGAAGIGSDAAALDSGEPPVGAVIRGDAEAITGVLDRLLATTGVDDLTVESDGDQVVLGAQGDWVASLREGGDLAGSDAFDDVVVDEDLGALIFVDFNAGDWIQDAAEGEEQALDILTKLSAFGLSAWSEDGTGHVVAKVTFDD